MAEILRSSPQLPSPSSSITGITPINNDGLAQQTFLGHGLVFNRCPVALWRRNYTSTQLRELGGKGGDQLSVLAALATICRKSLVGCKSLSGVTGVEEQLMEIGRPTNVRHVAHVTFDRFNGFLGLPVEFEPEVPRRPPSASTRVFGVSTESMQLCFDSRGNCVPTILLMMQRRLYAQGGLQSEGIFRINPENGQEEYVREQLNNGFIPDDIDVHCLAGLIKAWFRELPRGILDPLSPEQVMQAQSEDECTQLVRLLPLTEASLLDWAINLMADVAQFENLNKMNARNVAMVFAPNMTQMTDPLTALMYAVQVMNFLKTLIVKTLRERQDSMLDGGSVMQLGPSDEDGHHSVFKATNLETIEANEEEEATVSVRKDQHSDHIINSALLSEHQTSYETHGILSFIEDILADGTTIDNGYGMEDGNASVGSGRAQSRAWRMKNGWPDEANDVKKESTKHSLRPTYPFSEIAEKNKEMSILSRVNSRRERTEAWR